MVSTSWISVERRKALRRLRTAGNNGDSENVWLEHVIRRESLLHDVIEGRMRGQRYKRSEKNAPVERPDENRSYVEVKQSQQQQVKTRRSVSAFEELEAAGREFQILGAATLKLHGRSIELIIVLNVRVWWYSVISWIEARQNVLLTSLLLLEVVKVVNATSSEGVLVISVCDFVYFVAMLIQV